MTTRQQVNDFTRVLMSQWEIIEGKPVRASYVAMFANMARALLTSPALARVIREAKADGWDEGAVVGDAYGMDAISLNPMHANPYRDQTEEPT